MPCRFATFCAFFCSSDVFSHSDFGEKQYFNHLFVLVGTNHINCMVCLPPNVSQGPAGRIVETETINLRSTGDQNDKPDALKAIYYDIELFLTFYRCNI